MPEPIELRAKRYNFFPAQFIWRGQAHHVQRVLRVWSEQGRRGRRPRTYYWVRCNNQLYRLFQDVALNAWYIEGRAAAGRLAR